MDNDRNQKIRERAHAIWQDEGQPHGRHEEHWHRASREVGDQAPPDEDAAKPKATRAKRTVATAEPADKAPAKPARTPRAKKSAS